MNIISSAAPKTSFRESTPRANVSEITTVPGLVVDALNLKGFGWWRWWRWIGSLNIIAFMMREIQLFCSNVLIIYIYVYKYTYVYLFTVVVTHRMDPIRFFLCCFLVLALLS